MKRQRDADEYTGLVSGGGSDAPSQLCRAVELEPGDHGSFFFARGLLPEERVLNARARVLQALRDSGDLVVAPDGSEMVLNGLLERQDVATSIGDVLEAPELVELVRQWTGSDAVAVFPYKWLRAVNQSKCTGFHVDRTYLEKVFGDQTNRVISAWIPIGEIGPELGSLLVCRKELNLLRMKCLERQLGNDGTDSGWIAVDQALLDEPTNWGTTVFRPG